MTYCINPHCPKPVDPVNANNLICRNCGSEILLQGCYRVIKQLGQGGFGNTFEVDERGKTKVLKVLTDNNPKAIELFQQEARVLSQLNSAGIPKVEPDGYFTVLPKNSSLPLHCLAMEKIEGVNLEQWMEFRNYQRISETQALNWLKQLVEILALVHAHQYFHRDIKPQNIMLRPSGQLVLIDFGAVRQVTTTILAGNSHTRIISQGYSPPEQQNGYSVQQSDFFALGRTFIFLLTGKEPQDKEIYDPLTNELHWRKSALNISPLLADLIDHLMAPTANQRPQNTQVILQKLSEIEKALQMPRILWQKTAIQSSNGFKSVASSSSVATVSVGRAKSVNASSSQTQKNQKLWQVLIGLGLGCFAVAIAAINQPNAKNPVSVSPVENVPVAIPSPVTQIPEIPLTVKSQPTISPLTLPTSDKVETEQAQIEEIEKQKLQAALKTEEERQAAIRKEAAVRTAREQLEAVIREKREMRKRREQLNADIRARALITQKRQQADKQQQTKISLEKAKQVYLQIKAQPKTTITTSNKRQVPPKQKVTTERPNNAVNTNNDGANIPNPWESTYPIPKTSDELEQVIREGNQ
ncbi:serine/threonine protein kinase [Nostoc sp. 'Peltigera membranacea cyanobiont' 210A]|uniref:serine/threonine protein kinase n=1 Tax=Nostoc sp. 'Peltigera membranacea cyanobiont' 210A TaxID=2014529 RepID=UPI000B954732|nr:serine/threonine-protein kinase [Nostoc sp. 'Peltigera membranacea cyanobiont' 210A]OYD96797.1 serine/threonine protein kinase [Nostoc sp. 'Peltigera membranacea cyanobiont' 210A]